MQPEYQHKLCQKLYDLYLEHKGNLGKGLSMYSMLWRSIEPSVPDLLGILDSDEKLLGDVKRFLAQIMETMREDLDEDVTVENKQE